jgi:hypothetical protein
MATFAISAVTRKAQATANGSTTEFSFSFSVNTEADVAVFVGTTLKTISTHYTVSITSSTGAGSITFTSGNTPTNGQIVTIMSKTALARSSVYTSGGTINATSLETDFDTNMMLFQQQDERLDRTLIAPVDDPTSIDMTLPNKDARKGKVLNFNATTGNPEVGNFTTISDFTVSNDLTVSGKIALADNVQLNLGTSEDFKIYHDGSVTFLTTSGTAANEIRLENNQNTSDVRIRARNIAGDSTVDYMHVDSSHGHVYLFYNGLARMKVDDDEVYFYKDVKTDYNIVVAGTVDGRDVATDGSKLDGIEANADVTDTTNVTAAGAIMDSEVTNLAEVKAFASSDYATAAQGTLATNAMPKGGGAFTGAVTTNSTFDGVDIATRDAVLTATTTTANAALPKGGGTMTGALKTLTLQETYVANSTGATTTLDLSTGTSFSVTLSENTTFAFTLPTLPNDTAFSFTLFITQPSSAVTIAWPASVDWAGSSAPAAPGDSEVNAYGFYTRDGGTTYYGFLGGVALG